MNIALISISALRNPKEATRITILELAQSLSEKGHNVTIICRKAKNCQKTEKIGSVTLYRIINLSLLLTIGPALALNQIQKKLNIQFNIVHAFSATPLFALSNYFTRLFHPKIKIINTLKSSSRHSFGDYGYFLLKSADKITIPTSSFLDKINSSLHSRIEIIPSPVNLTKFYPQNKNNLKKKYGYQNTTIIFHYGAMWENKGTNILIQSMPDIIKTIPDVLFLFAPRYKEISSIQQQIEKITNLNNHHKTTQDQKKKYEIITTDIAIEEYVNLADIIVLPYLSLKGTESVPSCLLEAIACKTPLVTTNLPEIKEIVKDTVLLAIPNNSHSLTECIKSWINKPNTQMIEKAYHLAQKYSSEKIVNQFLKEYIRITTN
jgi:glycosyltransferase involved in cell wall biosynthesis